jgi:hypothetical protein
MGDPGSLFAKMGRLGGFDGQTGYTHRHLGKWWLAKRQVKLKGTLAKKKFL